MEECIKEKRFLFLFKYKVIEHDFKMESISKFMDSSKDFQVRYRCSKCGAGKKESFVSGDELRLKGIPQDILNKIDSWNWHYCDNKTPLPA